MPPLVFATAVSLLMLLTPPSGRPPVGPLERFEPRVWDFTFEVTLSTVQQLNANDRRSYDLADAPIVMPVIFQSTFSKVDAASLNARMWFENREDTTLRQRTRLDQGYPFQTQLAVMPVARFVGQSFRWQFGFTAQSWSSRIDDARVARIAWPKEWPAEVRDGLTPQLFIESDDPVFAETVERITNGRLRFAPPYLAAKEIVRYCLNNIQVTGNGEHRGAMGQLHGLELDGAAMTARRGMGSPLDLVCVCVAMLRAANIPARVVIGAQEDELNRSGFVTWAELYLPDAGWIPFDPIVMRGKGIRTLNVNQPWPEFGTMKDLNRRIPLSYHFIPPATLQSPQNPAVWGWDPRPGGDPSSEQQIRFTIISKGRGEEEPR